VQYQKTHLGGFPRKEFYEAILRNCIHHGCQWPERHRSTNDFSNKNHKPTAPIKIISYNAVYIDSSSTYVSRGIHHNLEYENASGRTVVAVQFGLVSFDIWNEFLDRTGVVTMEAIAAGSKEKGKWVATSYADSHSTPA